jgi:protein ImuA
VLKEWFHDRDIRGWTIGSISFTVHKNSILNLEPTMSALSPRLSGDLPACLASAAVWRGDALGRPVTASLPSGFAALDAALPGGGWPGFGLTELLMMPAGALEFRLLGPALGRVCAAGRCVALVGPPQGPHLPGLLPHGILARQLVWVRAETVAERLWATEQLIKAGSCGAVVAWLPRVRSAQLRRLQVLASAHEGPVWLCRPADAARESSAAPLRLLARPGDDWALQVDVLKRKGPPLERTLQLPSVPAGLSAVLPPRLLEAGHFPVPREADHAVVRAPTAEHRRPAVSH